MNDQPATNSNSSTPTTTPTTSATDVQRRGGEAQLQNDLKQVDSQVGQNIPDQPYSTDRDAHRRGIFIDKTAGEKPGEDTNPSSQDMFGSQNSTPATTSTSATPMTTPTTSVSPTQKTSE